MIKITDSVFVDPLEVASIELESIDHNPPSGSFGGHFSGSVITLKNGRKIYIRGVTPGEVMRRLNPQAEVLEKLK